MLLETSIDELPKTRSLTIKRLRYLGINTYWDLLNYFPFRYEDYSLISKISQVQEGEVVTVKGKVVSAKNVYTRKGIKIQKIVIEDETGKIELVWYNQPYLINSFKKDSLIAVSGRAKKFLHKFTLEPEEYELLKTDDQKCIHTGKIIPIYPEKRGLSSRVLREKIHLVLNSLAGSESITELFPSEIVSYNKLLDEKKSYYQVHFPDDKNNLAKARERLAFDELFIIQLSARLIRKEWSKEKTGHVFNVGVDPCVDPKKGRHTGLALQEFVNNLPFQLTGAQQKVVGEIIDDLKKITPMNRFLQGDVGSGKTVVAAIACYLTYLNGLQSLIMAPTEILAFQHYQTIKNLFKNYPLKIALQTGSEKHLKNKKDSSDLVIGTHALLSKKLDFKKVGFVVIDEQHRFGVSQRAALKDKGTNPHLLTMTATPIPRTVALTLYGELDISIIDEMPRGRLPVKTFFVNKEKRADGYLWLRKKIIKEGIQVFIICPLIEESEVETMKSVKAVTKEYEDLKQDIFPDLKLGLLHGKMKSKDKDKIMKDFKDKKYDILLATSVVEVGIDIPNAAIILIEGAERYGLAQLHQLRGRVGRGDKQSYCLLFSENSNENIIRRLNMFCRTNNGMELAEYDLKTRGPGQIYGQEQHGFADLKIASFSDYRLIDKTKKACYYFLNNYPDLTKFPSILKRIEKFQIDQITRD